MQTLVGMVFCCLLVYVKIVKYAEANENTRLYMKGAAARKRHEGLSHRNLVIVNTVSSSEQLSFSRGNGIGDRRKWANKNNNR